MKDFSLLKEAMIRSEQLNEMRSIALASPELAELFDSDGNIINEDMKKFIKDAREFLKQGLLQHYNAKNPDDKEDENNDGEIKDPADRFYYFAKMIGGLLYYKKKDLKKDKAAFDQIVKGILKDKFVDKNIKVQAERNSKTFVKTLGDNFKNNKDKIENYIDQIEDYFLSPA